MKYIVFAVPFLLCALMARSQSVFHSAIKPFFDESQKPFYFSVASGDPKPNGVVIWTKIFVESTEAQEVEWEMSTDEAMQQIIKSGTETTTYDKAFTVKLFVENLIPNTTYYYRFKHQENYSPIGRTKTAPEGDPSQLRLAVVSCADFQSGEYNAYGHIAQRNDIDAVVHLGDYIYEHGARKWGRKRTRKSMTRTHIPAHTCRSLKDYRTRYAQYRLDKQLQECHRLHPFITIWDDHEITNNVNSGISGEAWENRESAARQAYFEWLPIQDNEAKSIIRSFSFGNLAEMWMLDGRLEGRSPQASGINDPNLHSDKRHMLGKEQTEWLLNGMVNSKARWKIMGNQVIFSPLHDSNVFDRRPEVRMDRWDGYPAEQQFIFDFFYENNIQNIIVITGDVHTAWALELTGNPLDKNKYDRKTGKGVIGAEFVAPSVTSFNLDEIIPKFIATEAKRRLKRKKHNPHLKYVDLVRHGYFTLTFTPERAKADWFFIKRKDRVDLTIKKKKSWGINFNGNHVTKK
ncbi:MAG: alkaline phosphatase D family protein [Bacteroidota bacterium]